MSLLLQDNDADSEEFKEVSYISSALLALVKVCPSILQSSMCMHAKLCAQMNAALLEYSQFSWKQEALDVLLVASSCSINIIQLISQLV